MECIWDIVEVPHIDRSGSGMGAPSKRSAAISSAAQGMSESSYLVTQAASNFILKPLPRLSCARRLTPVEFNLFGNAPAGLHICYEAGCMARQKQDADTDDMCRAGARTASY